MTSLLLALALVHQDPLTQKVEFSAPITPLRQVVAQIAQKSKTTLVVSDALLDAPIFLKSQDLTLKEIMDGLGHVTFGQWVHEGDSYRLVQSPAKVAEAINEDAQRSIPQIQEFINKRKAALSGPLTVEAIQKKLKEFDDAHPKKSGDGSKPDPNDWQVNYLRQQSVQQMEPSGRLVVAILKSIGAKNIGSVPLMGRKVFSTHPTQLQYPINSAVLQSAYQQYVQERDVWSKAGMGNSDMQMSGVAMAVDAVETIPAQDVAAPAPIPAGRPLPRQELPKPNATEIHLILQRDLNSGGFLSAAIESFDDKGNPTFPTEKFNINDRQNQAFQPPADPKAYFKYSPESIEFNRFLTASMGGRSNAQKKVANPERFLRVLERDPLNYSAAELVNAWVDSGTGQGVFNVPDIIAFLAASTSDDGERGSVVMAKMFTEELPIFSSGTLGRVTFMRPSSPRLAEMFTSDRPRMNAYLDRLMKRKAVDPEDQTTYLAAGEQLTMLETGRLLQSAYLGAGMDENVSDIDSPLTRLYGRLNTSQRAQLLHGDTIPIQTLTPTQRKSLDAALYDAQPRLSHIQGPLQDQQLMYLNPYNHPGSQDIWTEPTTTFPIEPSTGVLRIRAVQSEQWFMVDSPSATRSSAVNRGANVETMGQMVAQSEQGDITGFSSGYHPPVGQYVLLEDATQFILEADFGKGLMLLGNVSHQSKNVTPKPVALDQMPEPYKSRFLKAKSEMIAQMKEYAKNQRITAPVRGGGG